MYIKVKQENQKQEKIKTNNFYYYDNFKKEGKVINAKLVSWRLEREKYIESNESDKKIPLDEAIDEVAELNKLGRKEAFEIIIKNCEIKEAYRMKVNVVPVGKNKGKHTKDIKKWFETYINYNTDSAGKGKNKRYINIYSEDSSGVVFEVPDSLSINFINSLEADKFIVEVL